MVAIQKNISDLLDNPQSAAYNQIDPLSNPKKTFRELGITNEKLDWANLNAEMLREVDRKWSLATWEYIEGLRRGTVPKSAKRETYYWQMWVEQPILNRLMSGFFLWTSKLDGIAPWCYQMGIGKQSGDPFDDWDGTVYNNAGKHYKDQTSTYPSAQGPIPTTKWEAMREGYDDVRYLTTLVKLLDAKRGTRPDKVAEIEANLKKELEKYQDTQITLANYNGYDFQNTRKFIIDSILGLSTPVPSITSGVTPIHTPTPTPTPKPAFKSSDANNDGKVDAKDYDIWLSNFFKIASSNIDNEKIIIGTRADGDFNNDGRVNGIDYSIWVAQYGT